MNLKNIKCLLLDLDGTIYLGGKLFKGVKEKLIEFRQKGLKLVYLTNNSSKSISAYRQKLNNLGILEKEDIIYTSALAAASYLKSNYKNKKIFVLGTKEIKRELKENGLKLTESKADVALLTYDTEITYKKLSRFCTLILNGAVYIATHPDAFCPSDGDFLPDAGSYIALIKESTGLSPSVICGKPYGTMAEEIKKLVKLENNEIAMAGDRLTTDIQFAVNNGFISVLVLSGETDMEMYKKSGVKADMVLNNITELNL